MKLLPQLDITALGNQANKIRRDVVEVCTKNGAGHIAPSLSSVDILVALYYHVLRISEDPLSEERDRLIFSKAHGAYGLYSILCDLGYIEKKDWHSFYRGSFLAGCIERSPEHGIEAGCGALGHGLPMAVGLAFAAKLEKRSFRTFCVVGDGEMQEGSNWEAIQFAVKYCLSNLILIIDANRLQAMDFLTNILTPKDRPDDLEQKCTAFGMRVEQCEGHDTQRLAQVLQNMCETSLNHKEPQVLIAKTIKGFGLKCMENIPKFHFRLPTPEELEMGCCYE